MHWLFIAAAAPLLWAAANHIDKYLITKFGFGIGTKGLIIFSCLLASLLVIGGSFIFFDVSAFVIPLFNRYLLALSGISGSVAILLYLFALGEDETSVVAVMFQLVPVFGFLIGFVLLGEGMSPLQMLGSLIIIGGAVLIALDFKAGLRFKKKLFWLMFCSSLLLALGQVLFKFAAADNFLDANVWQYTGILCTGLVFLCIPSFRQEFVLIFKRGRGFKIFFFSTLVEILTLTGNLLVSFSILIAPVAMVLMVESFQPAFSFILGVLLTLFMPFFAKEDLSRKIIIQKVSAIVIILFGSYMLYWM